MPDALTPALRQLAVVRPDLIRDHGRTLYLRSIGQEIWIDAPGDLSNRDGNDATGMVHLWLLALARAEAFYPHMVSNHFKGGQWYVKLYGDVTHRSCLLKGEGYDADPTTALALALVEALRADP